MKRTYTHIKAFEKEILEMKALGKINRQIAEHLGLEDLSKEKITAELQLHSDQGFPYTSKAYHTLTKEYGITPSMSRRVNCYDNAVAENFFSIIKSECIYRQKITSFKQTRELIDEYIWFYNNKRIQLKTKLTPLKKRRQSA
ncbi:IS3 family transposase [Phascolarctobacterium faecium]|uniref:IS3 family transposase n=1 Tax=Phascolarctobacterium faecium TaxID=33025 RepID=UPI003FF084E3